MTSFVTPGTLVLAVLNRLDELASDWLSDPLLDACALGASTPMAATAAATEASALVRQPSA